MSLDELLLALAEADCDVTAGYPEPEARSQFAWTETRVRSDKVSVWMKLMMKMILVVLGLQEAAAGQENFMLPSFHKLRLCH